MAKGTRDYKWLEAMLKECEQKKEDDMSRVEERLDSALFKVEERLDSALSTIEERFDSALAELKAMMNGITLQQNEIWSQTTIRDHGVNSGSILGNLVVISEKAYSLMGAHSSRHRTKLDFSKFKGDEVDD